ncbi:MAG: precorrin-3B C(17)-methyltransferase [Thiohalomonadales bacterium]
MDTTSIKHHHSLYLIGIGPGHADLRLPLADARLQGVTDIVGYDFYFPFVQTKFTTQNYHASELGSELDRARLALDLAASGKATALISSGDVGIYAMAAVVYELLHRENNTNWQALSIEVVPGISAMQTLSARVGAVLGHDFCAISLSDLLTPWQIIEKRLEAAATGDFVVSIYNPVSKKRHWQLEKAQSILRAQRDASTPVAIGRNLGRVDERVEIIRLDELRAGGLDMLCIVIIGNSSSVAFDHNHTTKIYTPRGYQT